MLECYVLYVQNVMYTKWELYYALYSITEHVHLYMFTFKIYVCEMPVEYYTSYKSSYTQSALTLL